MEVQVVIYVNLSEIVDSEKLKSILKKVDKGHDSKLLRIRLNLISPEFHVQYEP